MKYTGELYDCHPPALKGNYSVFNGLYIIPDKTTVQQWNNLTIAEYKYNYFKVFGYYLNIYIGNIHAQEFSNNPEDVVQCGLQFVLKLLKTWPTLRDTNELQYTIKLMYGVLNYCAQPEVNNFAILKLCVQICTVLMNYSREQVIGVLTDTKFLPKLPEFHGSSPILFHSLFKGKWLDLAEKEYSTTNCCDLLLCYIQFVTKAVQVRIHNMN